jgi:hypothetical protein
MTKYSLQETRPLPMSFFYQSKYDVGKKIGIGFNIDSTKYAFINVDFANESTRPLIQCRPGVNSNVESTNTQTADEV